MVLFKNPVNRIDHTVRLNIKFVIVCTTALITAKFFIGPTPQLLITFETFTIFHNLKFGRLIAIIVISKMSNDLYLIQLIYKKIFDFIQIYPIINGYNRKKPDISDCCPAFTPGLIYLCDRQNFFN